MLPDCEVSMKNSDCRSILLAIITGLIANILSVEYQNCRLPGNRDNPIGQNEPHVKTVSYNDTLSTGRVQNVKIIVDVQFNR